MTNKEVVSGNICILTDCTAPASSNNNNSPRLPVICHAIFSGNFSYSNSSEFILILRFENQCKSCSTMALVLENT